MSEKKQIKVQLDYLNPYLKRYDRDGNRLPEPIAMSAYRVSGDEDAIALWEKTQDVLIKEKDDEIEMNIIDFEKSVKLESLLYIQMDSIENNIDNLISLVQGD